ncbi:putative F-box only protein 10 [Gastrolobium bilobum]|uniref:putative F-box only protein 10 n=1 Tax=Gastrolobium bilobum TaxID=150636 RepID=UPI002AB098BD|nr:putative F-box only protein 10 [Gastrolobium bilobum]
MSGYCVPVDIVEQILRRLPPKSVGKCMTVCKSWNLLIKSHSFLSSYQHPSLSTPLFLVKTSHYQYHCLSSPSNMIERSSFPNPTCEYSCVSAVNGLVCLASYEKKNFILFNPLTQRSLRFPFSQTLCNSNIDLKSGLPFGFGFDSKKNDFKVVHMCYSTGRRFNVPPKVGLYSLNEGQCALACLPD